MYTYTQTTRDSTAAAPPLVFPEDTEKLKERIQIVCDRLGKGFTIVKCVFVSIFI